MSPSPSNSSQGGRRLAAVCGLIALVWLLILPGVARWDIVREGIERNKAAGIDAGAMFYTELPVMPAIRERLRLSDAE